MTTAKNLVVIMIEAGNDNRYWTGVMVCIDRWRNVSEWVGDFQPNE